MSNTEETTVSLRKLVNLIDEWRGDSTSLVDYMARANKGEEAINTEFIAKLIDFIESEKMRAVESCPIKKQKPTHGTCCTCSDCGWDKDDCMCGPIFYIERWQKQFKHKHNK